MIKAELLSNAQKLHLDTHPAVLEKLEQEWHILEKQLSILKSIDVNHVQPLVRGFEGQTTWLREDEILSLNHQELILQNAPQKDQTFVLLPKVVGHD